MIIKGRPRAGAAQLAQYLLTEHDGQLAVFVEQRGSLSDDLRTMLVFWETEALALTRGERPLYHMTLRLAPGEALEPDQWLHTLAVTEDKLGLAEQPRAIVAHDLHGERHLHVVYSRLDTTHERLINMGHDRRAHHAAARQMELEFGLRQVNSAPRYRKGNETTRSIEHRMTRETGISRQALCARVMAAWDASRTGWEFQEQLALDGITLAAGKRRDYVLLCEGKGYSPIRLLETVKTAAFRAKMALDPPRLSNSVTPQNGASSPAPCHAPTGVVLPTRRMAHSVDSTTITGEEREIAVPRADDSNNRPAPQLKPASRRARAMTNPDLRPALTLADPILLGSNLQDRRLSQDFEFT